MISKHLDFKWSELNHQATFLFCLKLILSAFIVYTIEQYFQWPKGFWAVLTVTAVIRPSIEHTCGKAIMRILGTFIGGFLAYILMLLSHGNILIITIGLLIISTFSGLVILHKGIISYAGVVIGLTAIVVLSDSLSLGYGHYGTVFIERTSLVMFGVFVAYTINILINILFKKERFNFNFMANLKHAGDGLFDRARLKSSLPMALLLAMIILITYVPWLIWQTVGGYWAAITCFFIIEERILGIIGKGKLRFGAHFCAASLGIVGVLLSLLYPPLKIFTLCFGYIIAGYIIVNAKNLSHTGNTFAIALTIMLLYDHQGIDTIEIVLLRFFYVLIGIIVGFISIKLIGKYIQKSKKIMF